MEPESRHAGAAVLLATALCSRQSGLWAHGMSQMLHLTLLGIHSTK